MNKQTILSLSIFAAVSAYASGAHDYTQLPGRGHNTTPASVPHTAQGAPSNSAAAAAALGVGVGIGTGGAALSVGGVGVGGQGGAGGQGGSANANNANSVRNAVRNTNNVSNRSSNRNANSATNGGNTLTAGSVTTGANTATMNGGASVNVQGDAAGSGDYSSTTTNYKAAASTAYAPPASAGGVSCRLFMGLGGSSTGGSFSGGIPIGNDQFCVSNMQMALMDRINAQRPGTFTSVDYLRAACAAEGMAAAEACKAKPENQAATPVMMPYVSQKTARSQYSKDTLQLLP